MNKMMILFISLIIIAGAVIADLSLKQEDTIVDKDTKALLLEKLDDTGIKSIPTYVMPKLNCSLDSCNPIEVYIKGLGTMKCRITPYYETTQNNGESFENVRVQYTDEELKQKLKDCEKDWLERVALRYKINRDKDNNYRIVDDEKEVTIR